MVWALTTSSASVSTTASNQPNQSTQAGHPLVPRFFLSKNEKMCTILAHNLEKTRIFAL